MATYKNKSVGAHVHAGKVVAPGGTFEAEPTKNLGKLVKGGVLEIVSGSTGASASSNTDAGDDKAALVARAKGLGVAGVGAHWGIEKLQEAIADAEKSAGPDGGEKKDA